MNVDDFLGGEVELDDGDAGLPEVGEEAEFGGLEEEEGAPFAVGAAGGAPDAVDVVTRVVGGVELDDPVDCGDLGGFVSSAQLGKLERCLHQARERQHPYRS